MGCRCANSHEEEYEINKREATKENIFKNKEGNELNNSKNHFSNNDFNSDKNNNNNLSTNLNEVKYFHGN